MSPPCTKVGALEKGAKSHRAPSHDAAGDAAKRLEEIVEDGSRDAGKVGDHRRVEFTPGDLVHGGQDNDFVFGDKGNDSVWGDRGNDTLTGGEGADTFFFGANSGNDVIVDFNQAAGDRLNFQGQTFTVSEANGSAVFELSGGGTIILQGVSSANLGDFLVA